MPSAALHPRRCWAREHIQGIGPCEGPLERAHLLRAQVIRREVGDDFETLWAPEVWRPFCTRHHRALDHSRQIRIPRALIPEDTERWAADHGLTWWLDREYPPIVIEGAWQTPGRDSGEFEGAIE